MKMTNAQMWEGIQALSCVKETGKLGYACARNLRRLMDACKEYMEVRDRLMKAMASSRLSRIRPRLSVRLSGNTPSSSMRWMCSR